MKHTTIDLLRHGACEGGLIFRGSTDSPLTTAGRKQMHRAITERPDQTNKWQNIISSPLLRCHTFAQSLGNAYRCPVDIEPALQEIHFGDWEGQLTEKVQQQYPKDVSDFWQNPVTNTPPNGETLSDFHDRVISAWDSITQQHKGQHSLIITHGGVIRIILAHLLQMPLRPLSFLSVPNACLSQIKIFHQEGSSDWPQLIYHQPLSQRKDDRHNDQPHY